MRELWQHREPQQALRAWYNWYHEATRSGASHLWYASLSACVPYPSGMLAHCRWPLGTNLIEGTIKKIKVIKRIAYGFRDEAYFFLRIRAAFRGAGR